MQGKTLAIYDKEEAYAEALSDYLNRNMELGMATVAFSDLGKLLEYLDSGRSEYVVVSEDFNQDDFEGKVSSDKIISLVTVRESEKNGPWIYKYQSAKAITKELGSIMTIKKEKNLFTAGNIRLVFSTKSGVERGEYVNILLTDLKNKGSVLYLNMEPFESKYYNIQSEGRGMSELIYYLKQGGDKLKWKFKTLIEKEGISGQVMPVSCPLDLCELTKEDVKELLGILYGLNEYETVLINLGLLTAATFELIKAGSKTEIVVTGKKGDRDSAENFISHMKLLGMQDVERRVEIIEFGTDTWL